MAENKKDKNEDVEEIKEESKQDDLFDENGAMKLNPNDKTSPSSDAQKKTLKVCSLLILCVVIIGIIVSMINKNDENNEVDKTTDDISSTTDTQDNKEDEALDLEDSKGLISKDGFLYDINSNEYALDDSGEKILYIYEADLLGEQYTIGDNLKSYTVKIDGEDVILTDDTGVESKISLEEYENITKKYYSSDDDTIYPNMGDADFMELSFMSMMKMNELEDVDTMFVNCRYIATNGDYAVVICSPQDNDDDLHGYVFGKDSGQWEIFVPEYQTVDNYVELINNRYAYMNVSLLTNMDINEYPKEAFNTNVDNIVDGMIAGGFITEEDLPKTYGVSVKNLMYLEFKSGKAFVGVDMGDNVVDIYPVTNTDETKFYFNEFSDNPPFIILKQY